MSEVAVSDAGYVAPNTINPMLDIWISQHPSFEMTVRSAAQATNSIAAKYTLSLVFWICRLSEPLAIQSPAIARQGTTHGKKEPRVSNQYGIYGIAGVLPCSRVSCR